MIRDAWQKAKMVVTDSANQTKIFKKLRAEVIRLAVIGAVGAVIVLPKYAAVKAEIVALTQANQRDVAQNHALIKANKQDVFENHALIGKYNLLAVNYNQLLADYRGLGTEYNGLAARFNAVAADDRARESFLKHVEVGCSGTNVTQTYDVAFGNGPMATDFLMNALDAGDCYISMLKPPTADATRPPAAQTSSRPSLQRLNQK